MDRRRATETVAQFVARLPPSSAARTHPPHLIPPWYWIHNPHSPPSSLGDVAAFTREGTTLLKRVKFDFNLTTQSNPGGAPRLTPNLRAALQQELADLAKTHGVTTGKWMLFPTLSAVDETWSKICHAVDANRLGDTAKVSTGCNVRGAAVVTSTTRLICVYTKDFTDVRDVKRVLLELNKLGLVSRNEGGLNLWYKSDAYTHLGIYNKNEFGLGASNYSSNDFSLKDDDGPEDVEMKDV
ncbi:hypothetical protein QBC44DRAFT_297729 [Cladorrhinum sp. PSN332]|nr:hypothetical protein QBC44DRAFT_297729 [Cladorrhinum sp. PSN332]